MATRLIKLEDNILVEVPSSERDPQQIAGGIAAKVEASLDTMKPVLLKICRPVMETVKELQKEVQLEQVEVEMGLSFDVEGNIYVTKMNVGANFLIRMTLHKAGSASHG